MVSFSAKPNTSSSTKKKLYTSLQIKSAQINGFRPYVVESSHFRYTGYWKQSRPDGFGARYSSNGIIYDGQWEKGMRHGQGAVRKLMPDETYNRVYVGQWRYDQKCGEGKQYYKNGVYYGWWKGNKRCGLGIMWYKDGSQYVGQWDNDLWDGAGVLFQENGNRYEGFFKDGKKHGEGIFFHLHTGQVQKGIWQEDICKVSMMFDCFRNQVDRPTPYPITRIQLDHPDQLIRTLFRAYFPEKEKFEDDFSHRSCIEIAREIRKRLQAVGQQTTRSDCGTTLP